MATVDGVDRQCLIDSGAGVSIIPRSLVRPETLNQGSSTQLHTANGQALRVHGTATLDIKLDSWEGAHTFLVADVSTGVILGVDFLHTHDIDVLVSRHRLQWRGGSELFSNRQAPHTNCCRVVLADDVLFDASQREYIVAAEMVDDKGGKLFGYQNAVFEPDRHKLLETSGTLVASAVVDGSSGLIPVRMINLLGSRKLYKGKTLGTLTEIEDPKIISAISKEVAAEQAVSPARPKLNVGDFDWSKSDLTASQREQLVALLKSYADVFSAESRDLGRTKLTRHQIPTGDAQPIRQRQYRQPYHVRNDMERQISQMLDAQVIQPSSSPWSSPVLLVPKKDGSLRFCVDFRKLNDATVKDPFPLPRIDESLYCLGGAQFFSTLDLASGYWQVEVEPDDRPKTAFTTTRGHYEFQVMLVQLAGHISKINGASSTGIGMGHLLAIPG